MKTLPSLIESGIAEETEKVISLFEKILDKASFGGGYNSLDTDSIRTYTASFATNVHNAAIESALEEISESIRNWHRRGGKNTDYHDALVTIHAKLSALKKENV